MEIRLQIHLVCDNRLLPINVVHSNSRAILGRDQRIDAFFSAVLADARIERAGAAIGGGIVFLFLGPITLDAAHHKGPVKSAQTADGLSHVCAGHHGIDLEIRGRLPVIGVADDCHRKGCDLQIQDASV